MLVNADRVRAILVPATTLEARDPYTGGHPWRVSQFSQRLATALGLGAAEAARGGRRFSSATHFGSATLAARQRSSSDLRSPRSRSGATRW